MRIDAEFEQVIRIAVRLFAELGYDGTTMGLIAGAAGVDSAALTRLASSKRDLYLAVMQRAYDAEMAALAPAITGFDATPESVERLIDSYLDFCVAHPEVQALWMHRRLADAADVTHLEELYVRPTHDLLHRLLGDLVAEDVNVEYAVWTIVWSVHGFVNGDLRTDAEDGTADPGDVAAFRAYLHLVARRLLRPHGGCTPPPWGSHWGT